MEKKLLYVRIAICLLLSTDITIYTISLLLYLVFPREKTLSATKWGSIYPPIEKEEGGGERGRKG